LILKYFLVQKAERTHASRDAGAVAQPVTLIKSKLTTLTQSRASWA
jgi:hypothetical protein